MSDRDEEARKIILARRRRFLAAAMAGVGTACADPGTPPDPSPVQAVPRPEPADAGSPPDAGTGQPTQPEPCLKVAPPEPCLQPPESPGADDEAPGAGQAPDAGTPRKHRSPGPRPCLKPAPPKE